MGQELDAPPETSSTQAPATDTSETGYPCAPALSPRAQQRLATAKSAVLIYAALLGLSPILKSLTRSTTSDSIWALSTWLLMMNVAFFDYSGGSGARFDSFHETYKLCANPPYPDCQLLYQPTLP